MSAQIDFTPALSRAYERTLEAERGPTQNEIDHQAEIVLRRIDSGDIEEALCELTGWIRLCVQNNQQADLGALVYHAIKAHCEKVALKVLEA